MPPTTPTHLDLTDALILVAGAATGLGRALAHEYALPSLIHCPPLPGAASAASASCTHRRGTPRGVVLVDVPWRADALHDAVDELRGAGAQAWGFACDFAGAGAVEGLAMRVVANVGVPDVVHCCLGIGRGEEGEGQGEEEGVKGRGEGSVVDGGVGRVEEGLRWAFEGGVLGVVRVGRAFAPAMVKAAGSGGGEGGEEDGVGRRRRLIVHTVSALGVAPRREVAAKMLPLCVCEAAVVAASQCMAASLRDTRVGVTVVFPPPGVGTEAWAEGVVRREKGGSRASEYEETGLLKEVGGAVKEEGSARLREAARDMVEEVLKGRFFASADRMLETVMVQWAMNGLDPNVEYPARR